MKKQNLLLVFALALGLANGQDIHAVEQNSQSTKETGVKDSINEIIAIMNNMDKELKYLYGGGRYNLIKEILTNIAQLYNMIPDVYQNITKIGIGSENENDLEEIKKIHSKIKEIVKDTLNKNAIDEDQEREIERLSDTFMEKDDNLLSFFENIGELIEKNWKSEELWAKNFRDEAVPQQSQNYANEQRILHRDAKAQYADLLQSIATEVYEEVEPGSTFRNALNRLETLSNK